MEALSFLRFTGTAKELELYERSLDACVSFLVSYMIIKDDMGVNEDQMWQFLPNIYRGRRTYL